MKVNYHAIMGRYCTKQYEFWLSVGNKRLASRYAAKAHAHEARKSIEQYKQTL